MRAMPQGRNHKLPGGLIVSTALTLAVALAAANAQLPAKPNQPADLSVMSYNVHGLPWPIATGRAQALKAIGNRLAKMRARGDQPHLVLLQEAFTPDAKAIARRAGYPYAVTGPTRSDRAETPVDSTAQRFTEGDRALKGEGDGAFEDSGLLVLSDYPVLGVKRMPYARYACAGYDCLANKGAVLVRVKLPGAAQPLSVIDTHMNSRRASGVPHTRSDTAYGWQAEELRAFVSGNVPAAAPAVIAGDFNIGSTAYRRAMITGGGGVLPGAADALRTALGEGLKLPDPSAAQAIVRKGKDWMFARGGCSTQLKLASVAVPFGREPDGKSLSDHFGYVAHYTVENAPETCGVNPGAISRSVTVASRS
jgi:endonuclease/exonuclease/phosphatase family metal-dependent hydrolase